MAGKFVGRPGIGNRPGVWAVDGHELVGQTFVVPDLLEISHRGEGNTVLQRQRQKLGLGVLQQPLFHIAVDFVGVFVVHPCAVPETLLFSPLRIAHHLQQRAPLSAFRRADKYVAILAAEDAVGVGEVQSVVARPPGHTPLVNGHQRLGAVVDTGHGLDFGDIYVLASTRQKSDHDGRRRGHGGKITHFRSAKGQRVPVRAAQSLADSPGRCKVNVVGLVIAVRTGQPKGSDRCHDKLFIVGPQGLVVDAQPVHLGGVKVMDEYLGLG